LDEPSFEKFGRIGYVSETTVANFVQGLRVGEIWGTKCVKCHALYFPPRADCKNCFSNKTERIKLTGECELITYSKVEYAPEAFKEYAPYVLAVAKLKEGPKVMAPVGKDVPLEKLSPRRRMKLMPIQEGERVLYELSLVE
jgi:hypothetical protein